MAARTAALRARLLHRLALRPHRVAEVAPLAGTAPAPIVLPAIVAAPVWARPVGRVSTRAMRGAADGGVEELRHAADETTDFLDEVLMISYPAHRTRINALSLSLVLLSPLARAQADGQKTFPSSKEALSAFVEAARAGDDAQLQAILGPGAEQVVSSGDSVADKKARDQFVASYELKHTLTPSGADQLTLNIGKDLWPVPIPLVHAGDTWYWDGAAGKEEILYRRIGHNELDAINAVKGVIAAQKDYAATAHDGQPAGKYAARIVSEPGKQNGLYWQVAEGETPSPAGPMLAAANAEGYDTSR